MGITQRDLNLPKFTKCPFCNQSFDTEHTIQKWRDMVIVTCPEINLDEIRQLDLKDKDGETHS